MLERPRTLAVLEDEFWTAREWRAHKLGWEERGVTMVAEIGHEVLGSIFVTRGIRGATRHSAEFGLVVAAAARGYGIGTAMIRAAEQWAREFGVMRMTLGVFAGNDRARSLYGALGYVEEGVEHAGVLFPEGPIDVIRMYRFLS